MTDAAMSDEAEYDAPPAEMPGGAPPAQRAIVPRDTIAGRALVAVIAIMTFLAALMLGAVVLIRATATEWQSEVAREITIQVRPAPRRDIEADVKTAAAVAAAQPGVAGVRPYSKAETARLL
jgi:cell division transport system permease protein